LLVKWIVVSNQPFTEVEVPEFRDLLAFLKPVVGDRMVKGDQMREKIMDHAEKARKRLRELLKVSILAYKLLVMCTQPS
jgi:hypothetical protein